MHGLDFLQYLPPPGVPVLATMHLPPAWYDAEVFRIERPQTWLHCVSRSQQDACPKAANLLPFIANGVPEDLPARHVSRRELALSLGRICAEKGYHLALAASERAGIPFLLAGQVYGYDEHQRYFREQILPNCGKKARFIGAVGLRRKRRLLTAARCLLVPSLAPETSSLVAMEAAMCGTPTIAFRAGALPEIVQDNVTGFLVDDVEQMAEAIHECRRIDPLVCRNSALSRFSETHMISNYFRMYQRLIGR
jgi:glycosyltransferase involved in cell wall biosynthesis